MYPNRTVVDRRRFIGIASTAGTVAGLALLSAPPAAADPAAKEPAGTDPVVLNGGFESGLTGWRTSGTPGAAHLDPIGHGGNGFRLTHYAEQAYTAATAQQLTGLRPGWLTVGAWVKSGGESGCSTLELDDGDRVARTVLPDTTQDDGWVHLTVSLQLRGRSATVRLRTQAPASTWATVDDVTAHYGRTSRGIRGVDLSSVPKNEDHGAVYFDTRGRRRRPEQILATAGANLGRLKVWVHPADGYNDKAHVVEMAARIKRAGMALLIDFHYSDTWADPGAQHPPAAWKNYGPVDLAAAVREHTLDVLGALHRAGITADYVQVGNEINPGVLWPLGQTWDVDTTDAVVGAQWANLGSFLTAGAKAVKQISPKTKVLLHLTNINNGIDSLTWWLDSVVAQQVPFDLIGLSYYGYWHGSLADLQGAITALSHRYDKDVLVLETAYPWTLADNPATAFPNVIDTATELVPGYPATPAGQSANLRAVQDAVAGAPGGRGLGTVYWEPAWTSVAGSGWDPTDPSSGDAWENQAVFDWNGRPLPALAQFGPDRAEEAR